MDADYRRIAEALAWLDQAHAQPPSLEQAADAAGLSPFHFQRLFTRFVGVSPKRYLQARMADRVRALLRADRPLLDTAYAAGLSGPGRLHDLVLTAEAVTPATMRRGGAGLAVRYGVHPSALGDALVAVTPHGICSVQFADGAAGRQAAIARLRAEWPAATIVHDQPGTRASARAALGALDDATGPLALHVRGTNFQLQVWRALLAIPDGQVVTYGEVAHAIGAPRAVRAVGSAVGANPVSMLIPCHRVLRGTGALGGYEWGIERKRVLLTRELSRTASPGA